jgi:hypothetical protein
MWRETGTPIISTWIDDGDGDEVADFTELWTRIHREVLAAERLVLYARKDDFPFKGALTEVGLAMGAGVPVLVVLDRDVELKGSTFRPLGSWIKHPGVRMIASLEEAFTMPLALEAPPLSFHHHNHGAPSA